ncbi:MAG: insulinase family protein [Ruminococcaceae bacterium]|nr:insulinase family protein [Oscillospiraceae bacterium]
MNETKIIGEEITLRYLPTDLFTTEYFSVHFVLPLREDTVSAYSLLAKMFKRGCRAYPSQGSFAKRLEELYASSLGISVTKQGERQVLSLGMDFLSSRFVFDGADIGREACALLCDVLCDPYLENGAFPLGWVEREKTALKDQLRATLNDKRAYAMKRCREIMCAGEAYSLALEGTEDRIDAITSASLTALYKKMLSEAQVEIFYIGSEEEAVAEERARALVKAIGERSPKRNTTVFSPCVDTVKRVTESVDALQGKLAMGFRTAITENARVAEKDALLLFNIIYGSSPISKLFMNVREKLSLCYYCASRNDNQKGVLFVQSGVENEKAENAESEILLQLKEIQDGRVTEDEMLAAKQAFRDLTRSVSDSPSTLEQWYLTRTMQGDNRTPEQMNEAINALSVEDVARAARGVRLDTVFFLAGNAKEGEVTVNGELH